jgi:hypothetical protein
MNIRTTTKYHLTIIKMAGIKKQKTRGVGKDKERLKPLQVVGTLGRMFSTSNHVIAYNRFSFFLKAKEYSIVRTLWHLQKFLQYIKYTILRWEGDSPPPFSFILPPPIPGILSTGLIFPFIYTCT